MCVSGSVPKKTIEWALCRYPIMHSFFFTFYTIGTGRRLCFRISRRGSQSHKSTCCSHTSDWCQGHHSSPRNPLLLLLTSLWPPYNEWVTTALFPYSSKPITFLKGAENEVYVLKGVLHCVSCRIKGLARSMVLWGEEREREAIFQPRSVVAAFIDFFFFRPFSFLSLSALSLIYTTSTIVNHGNEIDRLCKSKSLL